MFKNEGPLNSRSAMRRGHCTDVKEKMALVQSKRSVAFGYGFGQRVCIIRFWFVQVSIKSCLSLRNYCLRVL